MKQVIVLRKDLNMRKGKMAAQGAHAAMGAILNLGAFTTADGVTTFTLMAPTDSPLMQWLLGSFTKIAVSVPDEAALHAIYQSALSANIPASLIVDSGRTEFHGVPTPTAVAIGPGEPNIIDSITGHLPLL